MQHEKDVNVLMPIEKGPRMLFNNTLKEEKIQLSG
jgi:hypothetical protein